MKKSIKRIWYITLFLVIAVCCFSVSPMVNVANAGESGGMDFKKADNFIHRFHYGFCFFYISLYYLFLFQ